MKFWELVGVYINVRAPERQLQGLVFGGRRGSMWFFVRRNKRNWVLGSPSLLLNSYPVMGVKPQERKGTGKPPKVAKPSELLKERPSCLRHHV